MVAKDKASLARHIAGLDRVDRYILLMTYAEQMSCQEVALVLEWPEDRVRTRLETLKTQAQRALNSAGASQGLANPRILA